MTRHWIRLEKTSPALGVAVIIPLEKLQRIRLTAGSIETYESPQTVNVHDSLRYLKTGLQ